MGSTKGTGKWQIFSLARVLPPFKAPLVHKFIAAGTNNSLGNKNTRQAHSTLLIKTQFL